MPPTVGIDGIEGSIIGVDGGGAPGAEDVRSRRSIHHDSSK
jgi:hypothetical protein